MIKKLSPGVRYMLLAAMGFAVMHAIIKSLASFHVLQVIFFRSIITALLCTIFLRKQRVALVGNNPRFLLLRAGVGVVSMTSFFTTLHRIPMGASVSLKYLSPVFAAIFAVLFLRERVPRYKWLFFGLAVIGVMLLKGYDARIDTFSLILGLTGAVTAGFVYVIIRRIGQTEHPLVIINYFMMLAAVLSGLAMIPFWQTPVLYQLLPLLAMGTIGYFAQVFMTKALQIEQASKVAPIKYMQLIFSLIIGFVWFGETYTVLSMVGILLILSLVVPSMLNK